MTRTCFATMSSRTTRRFGGKRCVMVMVKGMKKRVRRGELRS